MLKSRISLAVIFQIEGWSSSCWETHLSWSLDCSLLSGVSRWWTTQQEKSVLPELWGCLNQDKAVNLFLPNPSTSLTSSTRCFFVSFLSAPRRAPSSNSLGIPCHWRLPRSMTSRLGVKRSDCGQGTLGSTSKCSETFHGFQLGIIEEQQETI